MANNSRPYNAAPTRVDELVREDRSQFPLMRINFIMMGACALLIIIGFLLMLGGSSDGGEFNPDIFSTRRIVVGPTITFIGFVGMAVAIIYRPRRKNDIQNPDSADGMA